MSIYTNALEIDAQESTKYYNFSLDNKSEQQKALESILREIGVVPQVIADIACGGGGLSVHLASLYPQATFTMVDENPDAISLARKATRNFNNSCVIGNIYNLAFPSDSYDLVICWHTLSWLDKPEFALRELVRICKPGGLILASSLFNLNHDVDIYSKVIDHTRASSRLGIAYAYNTYSLCTVQGWLSGLVASHRIHEFSIPVDLCHTERGLGTYTYKLETGIRLQISAGMLLNWGVLEVHK